MNEEKLTLDEWIHEQGYDVEIKSNDGFMDIAKLAGGFGVFLGFVTFVGKSFWSVWITVLLTLSAMALIIGSLYLVAKSLQTQTKKLMITDEIRKEHLKEYERYQRDYYSERKLHAKINKYNEVE